MVRQPDEVTPELVQEQGADAAQTKGLPVARELRLERFDEGLSAQVLHLGPYAEEARTIELLHEFIAEFGYAPRGWHHEIYLGDPRRSTPERLKTIIRQPVAARGSGLAARASGSVLVSSGVERAISGPTRPAYQVPETVRSARPRQRSRLGCLGRGANYVKITCPPAAWA
jgi:hypothetical protein